MFNDNQGMRKMALAITHYAYRNTAVEDYHSECVKMDISFYKKVYNIVYRKLKNAKLFNKYINKFQSDITQINNDYQKLLHSVPKEYELRFIIYLRKIFDLITLKFGSDWESAQEIDCNLSGKSLANYVLSGHFLECCKNGAILDDKTMCYINKDIHNRIYTLLVNDYFS